MYLFTQKKYLLASAIFFFVHSNAICPEDNSDYEHTVDRNVYAIPPPVHPCVEDRLGLYISGSFIYWWPDQDNMNTLQLREQNYLNTGLSLKLDSSPEMEAAPGFKAGLGLNTCHDGWSIYTEYTWFDSSPGMKEIHLPIKNEVYISPWYQQDIENEKIVSGQSKFCNLFNRVDSKLYRAFYAGNYVIINPWIGLLGAWHTQKFDIYYQLDKKYTHPSVSISQEKEWWCLGPYTGIKSLYYFFDHWSLFGTLGLSLDLGYNKTKKDVTAPGKSGYTVRRNDWQVNQMAETSIGIQWDANAHFFDIALAVGWEFQTWFNHNTFILRQGSSGGAAFSMLGDYSMQGVTASLGITF